MIRYRPFQNWDPPALAEIWRTQPPLPGRVQAVTPPLLEKLVFAKPWFDHNGLIVAVDGARPVGFAHAGFGASTDQCNIDMHEGTICQLMVSPHEQRGIIAVELLSAAEDYLRRRGAQHIHAGCQFPMNPFYLGLYGGSQAPGVLDSDTQFSELVAGAGFRPDRRRLLWRRPLAGFRSPVDRQWMQVRRRFVAAGPREVLPDNWWDACVWTHFDWARYDLNLPGGGESVISATLWDIEPLARSWGRQTAGLVRLDDTPEARDEGLTGFLLGEILRLCQAEGYAQFEAQTSDSDAPLAELLVRLGFEQYDRAALWSK
ncbi:MAG TPA: GNAT family N-acetyltransferase [Pirellulaceae bacterium]|nr:GNAT family N-acetyltransferase [Pirellulaceae bacterium]